MKQHVYAYAILGIAMASTHISSGLAQDTNMNASESAQPVTDTWITTKVKAELATTEGISSGDINVTTKNGVVTLSGMTNSKAQVQKAIALAEMVKGVKQVDSAALKARN